MSVEKAFMQLIQLLEQQSKYKVGCEKLHYTPYGRCLGCPQEYECSRLYSIRDELLSSRSRTHLRAIWSGIVTLYLNLKNRLRYMGVCDYSTILGDMK